MRCMRKLSSCCRSCSCRFQLDIPSGSQSRRLSAVLPSDASPLSLGEHSGKATAFSPLTLFPNTYNVKRAVFRQTKSPGVWRTALFLCVRGCLGSLSRILLQQDTRHTAVRTAASSQCQLLECCHFSRLPLRPFHSFSDGSHASSLPACLRLLTRGLENTAYFPFEVRLGFLSFLSVPRTHTHTSFISMQHCRSRWTVLRMQVHAHGRMVKRLAVRVLRRTDNSQTESCCWQACCMKVVIIIYQNFIWYKTNGKIIKSQWLA